METEKPLKYLCRACLSLDENYQPLFGTEINSEEIAQMFQKTSTLEVRPEDGLPQAICSECLGLLLGAFKFQQKCLNTDLKLREAVSTPSYPDFTNRNVSTENALKRQSQSTVQTADTSSLTAKRFKSDMDLQETIATPSSSAYVHFVQDTIDLGELKLEKEELPEFEEIMDDEYMGGADPIETALTESAATRNGHQKKQVFGASPSPLVCIPVTQAQAVNHPNEMQLLTTVKTEVFKLHAKIDQLLKNEPGSPKSTTCTCQPKKNTSASTMPQLPLQTSEELNALENLLRNDNQVKSILKAQLTEISERFKNQECFKVAYKIADRVFAPKLLMNYTWTGAQKKTEIGGIRTSKQPFQKFEGILSLFKEVVEQANDHYTYEKNVNFFKDRLLKHSKKRSMRKKGSLNGDPVHEYANDHNPLHLEVQSELLEFKE